MQEHEQRLNIVDLPLEILYLIFEAFRYDVHHRDRTERLSTIRSARLVCRVFNHVASPLLLPLLRVKLSQDSLDKAAAVARNTTIASGVREVHIVLRYRSRKLAGDIGRFTEIRLLDLARSVQECEYWRQTGDTEGPIPDEYAASLRAATMNITWRIRRAWDAISREDHESTTVEWEQIGERIVTGPEYRYVLCRAYEEYCRLHEEQTRLVASGSFVVELAAIIANYPKATLFDFVDELHLYSLSSGVTHSGPEDMLATWTSRDRLLDYLASPHSWLMIEEVESDIHHFPGEQRHQQPPEALQAGAEHLPASILLELPIALHRAGVRLRKLKINVFPIKTGHSAPQPFMTTSSRTSSSTEDPTPAQTWRDLRTACQHLQSFIFGRRGDIRRRGIYAHHEPEAQNYINTFLSCALSSPLLQDVAIFMDCFALPAGESHLQIHNPLGTVLESMAALPRIHTLQISCITATEAQLVKLCQSVGTRRLKSIHLAQIAIAPGGSWRAVIEILKQECDARCLDGTQQVELDIRTLIDAGMRNVFIRFDDVVESGH